MIEYFLRATLNFAQNFHTIARKNQALHGGSIQNDVQVPQSICQLLNNYYYVYTKLLKVNREEDYRRIPR